MMRFLGYLFLLLVVAAAALLGARYYLDRQATAFVTQAVQPIYGSWNFDALKRRESRRIQTADFERGGREMFRMFGRALGPLQSAAAPTGGVEFGWKSDAEIRGVYASYSVPAKFEHGEARLQFVVVKEDGVWRIIGFRVDSPAALDAVSEAIGKQGSGPSFQPGDPEATAAVTASAMQAMACLDSDAVGRCWDGASHEFKQSVSKQAFSAKLSAVRAKRGLLQNRKLRAVEFMRDMPGAPRGQYARAVFETIFSRATLEERLLFYKQDGEWVLSGYRWDERR